MLIKTSYKMNILSVMRGTVVCIRESQFPFYVPKSLTLASLLEDKNATTLYTLGDFPQILFTFLKFWIAALANFCIVSLKLYDFTL